MLDGGVQSSEVVVVIGDGETWNLPRDGQQVVGDGSDVSERAQSNGLGAIDDLEPGGVELTDGIGGRSL